MIVHTRHRWTLLAVVSAALFLIALDNAVLYTALPTLTHDLGASASQKLWIINAYPLTMAGLLLGAGTLGDRLGHVRLFVAGLLAFGTASVGAAFAQTPGTLIGWRAVLGAGAAVMMPATLALIRLGFDDVRERNLAIGLWGAVALVGAACGPVVGGLLLASWWWGSVFLVNVPVVVAALVTLWRLRPRNNPDPARRWDALSSVYVTAGLAGLVLVIKEGIPTDRDLRVVLGAAAVSAVALVLFVRRQRRLPDPLVDLAVLRLPGMRAGVLAAALVMFTVGGVQLVMSQRLQLVLDFSPLHAGLVVAAVAVGALPLALIGGAVLHRTGPTVLVVGGLVTAAVGVVLVLTQLRAGTPGTIAGLVVLGVGVGLVFSADSTVIITSVPARRAGMAASIEEVAYEMGSLIAVAALGTLAAAVYTSTVQMPPGSEAGTQSIDAARQVATEQPHLAAAVREAAAAASTSGTSAVLLVIAGALVAGSVLVLRDMRRFVPDPDATDGH